ncbi:TetR/AcrR family transcriptional regulator [Pseudarthrobacter sp. fls2-241-R2A-168]|uniref:TetR/AcrR family transcriptional regulator n=1 Tax=Pseudarthrobacter sp. fls2-241-R2A-168 TaxID=3040304 RepID=UPI0025548ED1|nr:TetR/AcrR family transcriptional regulator [Pseudarthrobacter sp. fls2-241-R2A-168]
MTSPADFRGTRTDARRNRAKILEVAESVFAIEGMEASMDSLAKRAGVGPATLYRHFPTRDALIAAVLEAHGPDLRQEAADIAESDIDAGAALDRWILAVGEWMRAYDGLPEPVRVALADGNSPLRPTCQQMIDTTQEFLDAAQRDGYARPGIRGLDLYLGALAAAWVAAATSADAAATHGAAGLLRSGWALNQSPESCAHR